MNGLILAEETIINTNWQDIIVTVIVALLSSTGLWGYLEQRRKKLIQKTEEEQKIDDNMRTLMVEMAKSQICNMCTIFITQGWISIEQAELLTHLYEPYREIGGNGAGEKLYETAMDLPRKVNVGRTVQCTDIQQGTSVLDDDRK